MSPPSPPVDLAPEAFRAVGHATIDSIVEYFASLADPEASAAYPAVTPAEVVPLFSSPPPEQGESLDAILRDWTDRVVPNSTRHGHRRFLSWVNGSGSQVGVLADALAAGLNANSGGWRAGQAATAIEVETIRWLAALMHLDDGTDGVFVSGGTMANTVALRLALHSTATWDLPNEGLQSSARPRALTVYMADHEAHISFAKALDLLGLGRNALRRVPSRDDFTIDTTALDAMVQADMAAGMTPFCIVAHAGSINVGAIDDFGELSRIAKSHGLWLHADGACGALGALLPELEARFRHMHLCDSVSFDAHKWMGVPYDCGCILVRDPTMLRRTFGVTASYLTDGRDADIAPFNYYDRGPQMSRSFRALKVWMSLRHHGAEGYRAFFRQTIDCARHAHAVVSASEDFEAIQPEPELYLYSFRYRPPATAGWSDDAIDALNDAVAHQLRERRIAMVMTTSVHGRVCQRFSVANPRTTREDITAVLEAMRMVGRELVGETGRG